MKRRSSEHRRAKQLRRTQTDTERKLWLHLRARQLSGMKFRRQHPVGCFIVDFCCVEGGLIVEVDGGQHADRVEEDRGRTEFLQSHGYRVLRFWDHEVLNDLDAVLQMIATTVSVPHPSPLPASWEREQENASPLPPLPSGEWARVGGGLP